MSNNHNNPDWQRVEKALNVEKEYGYQNLQGKQHRFHEFLWLTFGKIPPVNNLLIAFRWQKTAQQFAIYNQLTTSQRMDLISQTEALITEVRQLQINELNSYEIKENIVNSLPKTATLSPIIPPSTPKKITLDQPITDLSTINYRQKDLLGKLNIYTVRDLLFYYPRDHIDYARQINICDLEAGETVTVIGKVKKCDCFTSPKNKN